MKRTSQLRRTLTLLLGALAASCVGDDEPDPSGPDPFAAELDAGIGPIDANALPTGDGATSDRGWPSDAGDAPPMEAGTMTFNDGGATVNDASADAGNRGAAEPTRLAGITAAHNAARGRVATGTPIPPLTWGEDIAAVAQAYAEKLAATCAAALVHSTKEERRNWGENLASFAGGGTGVLGSPQKVVEMWESEAQCYTYGAFQGGAGTSTCSNACSSYGGCGHYTQVVWRKTKRVGCGAADCMQGGTRRSYWVCNYDPPGNYIGEKPY